ncbi:MAG: biotin-dependent carboxyltransferase family protein [Pyrinomonadaceae bacterium]
MSLKFLSNGILTTLQDNGRTGFRQYGINPNGAMDKRSARLINILLGNHQDEGVLEIHFPAPRILFEEPAVITLGGASFAAALNNREIENWRVVQARQNDVLSFGGKINGSRTYLAVRGGFEIEKWLGSLSTNLKAKAGGFDGRPVQQGDRLFFNQKATTNEQKTSYKISSSLIPLYSNAPEILVIEGAEWKHLTSVSKTAFLNQIFTIGRESDRMGFRIRGAKLDLGAKIELVSSAVNFGTIQLPPEGSPIILMADHQTTGGYPQIAHVINQDLPLVGQLGAGDKISFKMISLRAAENLTLWFEKQLNWFKIGCRFKNENAKS